MRNKLLEKILCVVAFLYQAGSAHSEFVDPAVLDACSGYSATNITTSGASLTADLVLDGEGCAVFGPDVEKLGLTVVYETDTRIHVKIVDAASPRFEVPETVLPRPSTDPDVSPESAAIQFNYTTSPFSFSIYRTASHEVLFSTTSHPLIFEPQFLRVKTNLPLDTNIYGLGEHTNPFRLPTENTTLTLWSRDAPGIPVGTNLYGNHPVYFEHRTTGTHGVFLLNSNGMDIKLTNTGGAALEYNVIGGVLDFYFLAGSTTDPSEVARQYAEIVGTPAEVPYWSFGFHQCRFGYKDFVNVAAVISNYSAAGIPLETMWTDIGTQPLIFSLVGVEPICTRLYGQKENFYSRPFLLPLEQNEGHFLMNDPAVAFTPGEDYATFNRGAELDVWLKAANGSDSLGLVWPGVTVFPDWFHPNISKFWNNEFEIFYDPATGIDIDGVWIDMNEPSSVPMIGSDVCGFGGDVTEKLCGRWAMLGAFYPFMRNHNDITANSQEFYIWASVTQAAKNVIDIRYRLLDYIYTAFHQAHLDGTPVLHPLWFKYPKDTATFPIDLQFFYGDSILVSPVTEEDSTSVTFYLPQDIFYDFTTLAPVQGEGSMVTLTNVSFTQIPLHIKGGAILPLRAQSAMTTTDVRNHDFEFVVAPGTDGTAVGALYIDDGVSVTPASQTSLKLSFEKGRLDVQGEFGFDSGVKTSRVRFLGVAESPQSVQVNTSKAQSTYDAINKVLRCIGARPRAAITPLSSLTH
ncbi:hypothetical protein C0993_005484 [Termitomyces sp. T159_Od127]|nr:hypothetical protein C0993_005484 [Termitomyces sp. T159_Od127]